MLFLKRRRIHKHRLQIRKIKKGKVNKLATINKLPSGSYRFTVSLGYDVNGKQIRRTTTWSPEKDKHYTPKQLEKELNRRAALFEEECKNGQVTMGGNTKLVDYIPQYLQNIKIRVAETTYKRYESVINTLIIPALGHMKLKDIKPIHVQRFVNDLTECNVITQKKKSDNKDKTDKQNKEEVTEKKLAPATVQRYYTCLRSIMHSAYRLEMISSNPCDSAKIQLPSIGEQKTEIYDKHELSQLLDALKDEPLQFQLLIHLAIITGCRRGELVALEWSDIDFDNGILSISKSAYCLKGQPTKIKDTKTHESRKVSVPNYCLDMLREHKKEQWNKRMKLGTAWQGSNWIFTQTNGSIMFPTSPTQMFSKFLKRKGLPHRKFHSLRHTSATLSLISGVDIKTVGERLGHSQMKTTNRYLHAIEETDKKAANILGNLVQSLQNGDDTDREKRNLS